MIHPHCFSSSPFFLPTPPFLSVLQGRGGEVSPGEVSAGLQREEREVRIGRKGSWPVTPTDLHGALVCKHEEPLLFVYEVQLNTSVSLVFDLHVLLPKYIHTCTYIFRKMHLNARLHTYVNTSISCMSTVDWIMLPAEIKVHSVDTWQDLKCCSDRSF